MKALEKSSVLQDSSPQEMNVGRPYPLRPTVTREGTNFSVFFANAAKVGIGYPLSARTYSVKPRSLVMLRGRYS
jgi:hypothetical protein